jgi:hypothetical protein
LCLRCLSINSSLSFDIKNLFYSFMNFFLSLDSDPTFDIEGAADFEPTLSPLDLFSFPFPDLNCLLSFEFYDSFKLESCPLTSKWNFLPFSDTICLLGD